MLIRGCPGQAPVSIGILFLIILLSFNLLELREAFAELLFLAVGLGLVNLGAFELLGQVFLSGVCAGAVVIVLVVDS